MNRDTAPIPTEFAIPSRQIEPGDIIGQFESYRTDIQVHVAEKRQRINMSHVLGVGPENKTGEAYVFFGKSFADLNGTYMGPEALFDYLSPVKGTSAEARALLLGDHDPHYGPILTLTTSDGLVRVNFFAGATSLSARTLSQIGDKGNFDETQRAAYQTALSELFVPVAHRSLAATKNALGLPSNAVLWQDVEDCAAVATHLAGVGLVLEQLKGRLQVPFTGRRIDVVVATAQSLTLLAHEAQRLGVPTEINAAFPAFGLSYGIGAQLDHKNYITAAPFPEYKALDGRIFIVGDMGAAGEWLPDHTDRWHPYRPEFIGLVAPQDTMRQTYIMRLNRPGSLRVAYARGGYLMMALHDWVDKHRIGDPPESSPTIMAIGKRLDTVDLGFGLRLDGFLWPLRRYIENQPPSTPGV